MSKLQGDAVLEQLKARKAELLAKFHAGEKQVFNEMVGDYYDKVQLKAQSMVKDYEEALDIVQELLIRMYNCGFQGSQGEIPAEKVCSYVARTLSNLCIDHLRRRKMLTVDGNTDFSNVDKSTMTVTILELIEEAEHVLQLAELEDLELQAFRYYDIEDYNFREISEKLEISEKQAERTYKKAKQKLQKACR